MPTQKLTQTDTLFGEILLEGRAGQDRATSAEMIGLDDDAARRFVHHAMREAARETNRYMDQGSTAALAYFNPETEMLTTGAVGDAMVWVVTYNKKTSVIHVELITEPHTVRNEVEYERLKQQEADFRGTEDKNDRRIFSVINPEIKRGPNFARAFGDGQYGGVIATPDITSMSLEGPLSDPDTRVFVLVGSDGFPDGLEADDPESMKNFETFLRKRLSIWPDMSVKGHQEQGKKKAGLIDNLASEISKYMDKWRDEPGGSTEADDAGVQWLEVTKGALRKPALLAVADGHGGHEAAEKVIAAADRIAAEVNERGAEVVATTPADPLELADHTAALKALLTPRGYTMTDEGKITKDGQMIAGTNTHRYWKLAENVVGAFDREMLEAMMEHRPAFTAASQELIAIQYAQTIQLPPNPACRSLNVTPNQSPGFSGQKKD